MEFVCLVGMNYNKLKPVVSAAEPSETGGVGGVGEPGVFPPAAETASQPQVDEPTRTPLPSTGKRLGRKQSKKWTFQDGHPLFKFLFTCYLLSAQNIAILGHGSAPTYPGEPRSTTARGIQVHLAKWAHFAGYFLTLYCPWRGDGPRFPFTREGFAQWFLKGEREPAHGVPIRNYFIHRVHREMIETAALGLMMDNSVRIAVRAFGMMDADTWSARHNARMASETLLSPEAYLETIKALNEARAAAAAAAAAGVGLPDDALSKKREKVMKRVQDLTVIMRDNMPAQVPAPEGATPSMPPGVLVGQTVAGLCVFSTKEATAARAAITSNDSQELLRLAAMRHGAELPEPVPKAAPPGTPGDTEFVVEPKWLDYIMSVEPDSADTLSESQAAAFRAVITSLNAWYIWRSRGSVDERPPQLLLQLIGGPGCGEMILVHMLFRALIGFVLMQGSRI
jgi:hypothetical protein